MRVIVLVMTLFFHGHKAPETMAAIVPPGAHCAEAGPRIKQQMLASHPEVRDVAWMCAVMKGGDNA